MLIANKNDNAKCDDLSECASEAGRKVRAFIDTATDQTRDAVAGVNKQVRKNPLQATAIAAGIGFVVGALLRRRV